MITSRRTELRAIPAKAAEAPNTSLIWWMSDGTNSRESNTAPGNNATQFYGLSLDAAGDRAQVREAVQANNLRQAGP
jgi:hypothetical protein